MGTTQGVETIEQLIHGFAKHIKHYKSSGTKEAEIRQQFIDSFWRPFAILTDFEQFRLFDTTLKPILEEPGRGVVTE